MFTLAENVLSNCQILAVAGVFQMDDRKSKKAARRKPGGFSML
jgi:hypothetical protein